MNIVTHGNVIFFFLEEKINLLIQTYNRSIEPTYKLLKTINDETIFKLIV